MTKLTGNPTGRPPKAPPPDAAQRIELLASDGFSVRGIAKAMGAAFETLQRWFDDYPELREAFENGREQERYTLHNGLYVAATEKGNMVAAMFLLKARHGYREGDQGETANRVSINFTLPGALKPEQFTIEHEPTDQPKRISAARPTRS
ncbi:MAG: hypothetical protein IT521_15365 [Burkholderiales bacterium]|nr:hypothetical protein [Burkholderiales bacterium]